MKTWLYTSVFLAILFLGGIPCLAQYEETLSADDNLDGGAPLGSITNSGGDGKRATPWLYRFTSGGLDCETHKVYSTIDADDPSGKNGTSFMLDMGGYSVTGQSGFVSFSTKKTTGGNWIGCGDVGITNVGTVHVGVIETYTIISQSGVGWVRIGTSDNPADDIRVDRIDAYSTKTDRGGGIRIYGSGDVSIKTAGGVVGSILAHGVDGGAGGVHIVHNGSLLVRDIDTHELNKETQSGGDNQGVLVDGGTGTGTAVMRDVLAHITNILANSFWQGAAGHIVIRNYQSVEARNIDTHQQVWDQEPTKNGRISYGAGDVTITNITDDIEITGWLDMRIFDPADTVAKPGDLYLSCGGNITLAELPIDKMKTAFLNAGGKIYVMGDLTGFPTSTPADGALDCPDGQYIYYKPSLPNNAYLGGQSYLLQSGGILRSAPAGTIVTFR